jgi:serine/threonine protein kinase
MQYLKQWHAAATKDQRADSVETSFSTILETNIMMPLDLLTDDRHLYSVMPYCNGGELFERLDTTERFPEPEARYWMYQVLNVRKPGSLEGTLLLLDSALCRPCTGFNSLFPSPFL